MSFKMEIRSLGSVSYTHLDVYKRQYQFFGNGKPKSVAIGIARRITLIQTVKNMGKILRGDTFSIIRKAHLYLLLNFLDA